MPCAFSKKLIWVPLLNLHSSLPTKIASVRNQPNQGLRETCLTNWAGNSMRILKCWRTSTQAPTRRTNIGEIRIRMTFQRQNSKTMCTLSPIKHLPQSTSKRWLPLRSRRPSWSMLTWTVSVKLGTWSIARSLRWTRTQMTSWTRMDGPFAGGAPSSHKSRAIQETVVRKASVYYLRLRLRLTSPSSRRSCTRDWSQGGEQFQTGRGSRLSSSFSRCATVDWRRKRRSLKLIKKSRRSSHLMRSSPGSCSAHSQSIYWRGTW